MNRIQLLDHKVSQSAQNTRSFSLKSGGQPPLEHSFFVPLHYEPNYAYPLVVWLHGPQQKHSHLKQVMPHVSMRNYVAVAPSWTNADSDNGDFVADHEVHEQRVIVETMYRVNDCVKAASNRFNIAPHRVFLVGYDRGGTMALRLGLAAPDQLAGVASIGGPVPVGFNPLSNLLEARQLPMLIAHGRQSDVYPVSRICEELRLFHVAGLSLNLRQYPCGHELTTQMLSDLDAWMMQIVTGVDSRADSSPDYLRFDDRN